MTLATLAATLFHPQLGGLRLYTRQDKIVALNFYPAAKEVGFNPEIKIQVECSSAWLDDLLHQFLAYFAGTKVEFSAPVDWNIFTTFQRDVLQQTCAIPHGQLRTYGQLAASLGKPGAARAVGAALGSNPIPILIPCHRVIGADGSLHGYSGPGGLKTKAWLLALEGHQFSPGNPLKLTGGINGNIT